MKRAERTARLNPRNAGVQFHCFTPGEGIHVFTNYRDTPGMGSLELLEFPKIPLTFTWVLLHGTKPQSVFS